MAALAAAVAAAPLLVDQQLVTVATVGQQAGAKVEMGEIKKLAQMAQTATPTLVKPDKAL